MTATVHRLTAAGPITEPEQSVIDELSSLLEMAKRGEIKGIGIFYIEGDDCIRTGWTSGCAREALMVAGAAMLNHRVCRTATE